MTHDIETKDLRDDLFVMEQDIQEALKEIAAARADIAKDGATDQHLQTIRQCADAIIDCGNGIFNTVQSD